MAMRNTLLRSREDPLLTQPHRAVWDDCLIVGNNNSRWLYMKLPDIPLVFEDPERRLDVGKVLADLLAQIGELSRDPIGPVNILSRDRQFHVITHIWFDDPPIPAKSTPAHRQFLGSVYDFMCPAKVTWIGVRLWASRESEERPSPFKEAVRAVSGIMGLDSDETTAYTDDYSRIRRLMTNYGCSIGTTKELSMLTHWYSAGRPGDWTIVPQKDRVVVDEHDDLEFVAVTKFNQHQFWPRYSTWIADIISHPEGAVVVSCRGRLQTVQATKNRLNGVRRRLNSEIDEQMASQESGGIDHSVDFDKAHHLRQVDDLLSNDSTAIIAGCSIVVARKARPAEKTFVDLLKETYQIEARVLTHQQMRALKETLPTTTDRVTESDQTMLIPMIAYSGIRSFSSLGDSDGALLGYVLPDLVPAYLSSREAAESGNQSAMTVVVADSGSGKSMMLQMTAYQYTQLGEQVVFINPKPEDDLSPLVDVVNGRLINVSQLEPGAFDPFRFSSNPDVAAQFLADYLLEAIPSNDPTWKAHLRAGIARGARAGARCAMDALAGIDDPKFIQTVKDMSEGSMLFRLGIGVTPQDPFHVASTLTLVQFDQGLDLPDPRKNAADYSDGERLALAAQMLVTRGALSALTASKGGVLILDEAHRWLQNSETLTKIQQVGREGRSKSVMPILATQRMGDFDEATLSTYITRVLVMKMSDAQEAAHCLSICGLRPTPELVAWLRDAGPKNERDDGFDRPPLCIHKDRKNRHSGMMLGPWPPELLLAFSTNALDRVLREAQAATLDPVALSSAAPVDVIMPDMPVMPRPPEPPPPPAVEPAADPTAGAQ